MIQGTENDFASVQKKAREIGINPNFVNQIYQKYAGTPQAKMLCGLFGTSPEALKEDAMQMVGENGKTSPTKNKFPRLK